MKKVEIRGLGGLFIEIYDPKNSFTHEELLKQAEKTIRREVLKYELRSDNGTSRQS